MCISYAVRVVGKNYSKIRPFTRKKSQKNNLNQKEIEVAKGETQSHT